MQARDWEAARPVARQAILANPNDPDLLTDAAKVFGFGGQARQAAEMLVEAARVADYRPASRVDFAVRALIEVGDLYGAIELLESALDAAPEHVELRRVLVGFLGEAERTEKIPPHFMRLIQDRSFDFPLLVSLTETSSRRFAVDTIELILKRNPTDHRSKLGQASSMIAEGNIPAAARVLEEILENHPDFAPAHALYGRTWVLQRQFEEIVNWNDTAPPGTTSYCDYWLTVADWAAHYDRMDEAARAYWQATRLDPNRSLAWSGLSHAIRAGTTDDISASGEHERAEMLRAIDERIVNLLELRKRYYSFNVGNRVSQSDAVAVAESLWKLGRYWEAEAWTASATSLTDSPSSQLAGLRTQILAALQNDRRWQSDTGQVALTLDLSDFPLPTLHKRGEANGSNQSSLANAHDRSAVIPENLSTEHLQLVEQSDQWGLTGIGANNNPGDAKLAALIRSTGAGGGAIDYDLDGYCDFVVMNAGGTMLELDSMPNDLMRNVGHRFTKVTDSAGVGDRGFGQGIAIGDYNEDGFPDLFFANLGSNRLLRNNGDGTFTECSDQLNDDERQWTSSAAFVDVNDDGISDLLTTNYCATVDSLSKGCFDDSGQEGPCHPLRFPARKDQFFVGSGNGEFRDVSKQWIGNGSTGRGLGILAGTLDNEGLGILIANDMSANFYFTPQVSARGDEPGRLSESAAARGVAVDGRTMTQASMGIAASDFDGDGDLDFYMTGFAQEYNILYEQISAGYWRDQTGRLKLDLPTLSTVGFGTQAIDLDGDGIDEIAVANGHIGEFPDPTVPRYEQPFQIFRRGSQGDFALLDDDPWGTYFNTPHVGRAMWRMDVNHDGRGDLMITHNAEQVRLLVNQSDDDSHRIAFRLVATESSRDAIGAIVRFQADGRARTLWQLAGDGYLCSNERTLRAGLGSDDEVTNVTITWSDGSVTELGTLAADVEYLVVQGQTLPYELKQW
ncbi:CRTAC1 family protein [Rubripirellula lacrimiformis]|nr:CRTAC1 family protein [Rubripirellula lacrimiformis]